MRMLRYARVFPPAYGTDHSTSGDSASGRTCPRMVLLALRVWLYVLVLWLNVALRKKQICLPLVFVVTLKYLLCFSFFLLPYFFWRQTIEATYWRLLYVPLVVVYSGRWAVTCSRACCNGF